MDLFKKHTTKEVAHGGVKCRCCCHLPPGKRGILRKLARHRLRQLDRAPRNPIMGKHSDVFDDA